MELLGRWVQAQDEEKHTALPLSSSSRRQLQSIQSLWAAAAQVHWVLLIAASWTQEPLLHTHPSFNLSPISSQEFPAALSPRSPLDTLFPQPARPPHVLFSQLVTAPGKPVTPAPCTEDQAGPTDTLFWAPRPFTCPTAGCHWRPRWVGPGPPPTAAVPSTVPTDRAGALHKQTGSVRKHATTSGEGHGHPLQDSHRRAPGHGTRCVGSQSRT